MPLAADWSALSAGESLQINTGRFTSIMPSTSEIERGKLLWLRYLLAAFLSALLIWKIPAAEIWSALKSADPVPLCGALALIFAARLLGALRTKVLTDQQGLSFSVQDLFAISCISTVWGAVLPGSFSGGIIRWYRMSRPERKGYKAFAVLAAERVIDFGVLAMFGLLCLAFEKASARLPLIVWCLAAVAGTCLLLPLAVFFGEPGHRRLQSPDHKIARLPQAVLQITRQVLSAFLQYRGLSAPKILVLLSISTLLHAVATLSLYMMSVSLNLNLTYVSAGWTRACTLLLTSVPLTPSGLGVREFSFVFLLLPFGVQAPQAVAFSLMQFGGFFLVALSGAFMDTRYYMRVPPGSPLAKPELKVKADERVP
jgi:uncharacterized protein (TIRG00374 family)